MAKRIATRVPRPGRELKQELSASSSISRRPEAKGVRPAATAGSDPLTVVAHDEHEHVLLDPCLEGEGRARVALAVGVADAVAAGLGRGQADPLRQLACRCRGARRAA